MFEAYSVAIRVSLINGVTSGLMNISRSFARAHGDAQKLQRQLDAIKFKLVAGAALTGTGLFGLSLIEKTIPAAREYAHQIQQMNVAGMKQVEIANSVKAAWGAASAVPTATATENLKAIRELRMVFGNTQEAIANVATVQKLQAILANTANGQGGKLSAESAYTVAKALEMRGATRNPAEFAAQSDMMTKAIVASGGKVAPQDFLNNIIYGRRAAYGWDNVFTYQILPTLMQEMKGGGSGGARGPGNALMSAYATVVGGTIPQKALEVWNKLGLLDRSKVVWSKVGTMHGVKPGGVAGSELFQTNPYAWAQQVLLPALQKHGDATPEKVRQTLQFLFPNRTASIMDQMVMQAWKFQRDQKLIQGASGLSGYNALVKRDPFMAQQALEAQWTNVKTQLGLAVLPMLITGTIRLTHALTGLSNWMGAHPKLTDGLVLGFTALSAAMAFGGAVILLSAAFSAVGLAIPVVVAGFSAIGGGISALALAAAPVIGPLLLGAAAIGGVSLAIFEIVKHWDSTKSVWANIKAEFSMFVTWIWDKVKWLLNKIPGVHIDEAVKPKPSINLGPAGAWMFPDAKTPPPSHVTPSSGSRFIAPQTVTKSSMKGDVYLDGRKVGDAVWRHHADALDRASWASAGDVDPGLTLVPVGAGYA